MFEQQINKMAAENKLSRSSTPVDDSGVNKLSFSVDSLLLGDSTRSLLSPLYGSDRESLKERPLKSDDEDSSEGEIIADKYANDVSMSRQSTKNSSISDNSEAITVKKVKRSSPVYRSGSLRSNSSQNSTYSSKSYTTPTSNNTDESENETMLSPWEKWLMSKVIEDREKVRLETKKKRQSQEMDVRKMTEETEKERKAEMKRKEWLLVKKRAERIKNELQRREENAKVCKEQEERQRIEEKGEESYKNWCEMKEHEREELTKNKKKGKRVKKESESERKQKSQDAYQEWLNKAKNHRKSTNNHFGYLSGRVMGYYDWTCYPMPSYNNPNPWVSPKVKKKYQGKLELQRPSPPLLFKELEKREQKLKDKNVKLKMTKKGI